MSELRQYERFSATFQPPHLDDLKATALPWIGWQGTWEVLWWIEPDDHSRLHGQWACGPVGAPELPFTWVPLEDLRIRKGMC